MLGGTETVGYIQQLKMALRGEYWWRVGEAQAIAVYRPNITVPLLATTALVVTFLTFVDLSQPGAVAFLVSAWILFSFPILIWRRRAIIFTPDFLLFRPVLGTPLKVPLKGVKHAYLSEAEPGKGSDYSPCIRIQLLVGGEMNIPPVGSSPEEIIRRLNGQGGT